MKLRDCVPNSGVDLLMKLEREDLEKCPESIQNQEMWPAEMYYLVLLAKHVADGEGLAETDTSK